MDKEMGRIVVVSSWTHNPPHPLNGHIETEEQTTVVNDFQELARPLEKGCFHNRTA